MDRAALGAQLSSQVDSSRSISAALAARAVNNSSLKALMAAVAAGQGSEDQLTTLQRHVDQITYLRDVTQQTLEICQIRLAKGNVTAKHAKTYADLSKVRDAVFSDLKTCENIFLYLNTRDVLSGVQQTCKAWKDVVDKNDVSSKHSSSSQLRQHSKTTPLWIRPGFSAQSLGETMSIIPGSGSISVAESSMPALSPIRHISCEAGKTGKTTTGTGKKNTMIVLWDDRRLLGEDSCSTSHLCHIFVTRMTMTGSSTADQMDSYWTTGAEDSIHRA